MGKFTIATFYKVLAVIVFILGCIVLLLMSLEAESFSIFIIGILSVGLFSMLLYWMGAVVEYLRDISEHIKTALPADKQDKNF